MSEIVPVITMVNIILYDYNDWICLLGKLLYVSFNWD